MATTNKQQRGSTRNEAFAGRDRFGASWTASHIWKGR